MRPERKRDHLQSTGLARARMYLKAHLDWLDGWPVEHSSGRLEWQLRPALGRDVTKRIVVDRERLRQTETAFHKLAEQFPRAMPRIVGDVAAWREQVESLLERLKSAVHQRDTSDLAATKGTSGRSSSDSRGKSEARSVTNDITSIHAAPWERLPRGIRDQMERLVLQRPALREVVRAVVWTEGVRPASRESLLDVLLRHADWLEVYLTDPESSEPTEDAEVLEATLLLLELIRSDGDEAVQFVKSILGDVSRRNVLSDQFIPCVMNFVHDLKAWDDVSIPPEKPMPPTGLWGLQTTQFVMWLAKQKAAIRKRAVRLINLFPVGSLLDEWVQSWDSFLLTSHAVHRGLCDFGKTIDKKSFHDESQRIAEDLGTEFDAGPISVHPQSLFSEVRRVVMDASETMNEALSRLLSVIPMDGRVAFPDHDGLVLRMISLREVAQQIDHTHWSKATLYYLHDAEAYFRRHRHQDWCSMPWKGTISAFKGNGYLWQSPRESIVWSLNDRKECSLYFEALERLACHPSYSFNRNDTIASLVDLTNDVEVICRRFQELVDADLLDDSYNSCLKVAAVMETEGHPFGRLSRALKPVFDEARNATEPLFMLSGQFAGVGWPQLLPAMLESGRAREIARMISQCAALGTSVEWPSPKPRSSREEVPDWASHFPTAWQSPVAQLCDVLPNAQKTVERLLADVCPGRSRLDREIAVLQQRLEQLRTTGCDVASHTDSEAHDHAVMSMSRRLASLIERREHPKPLSDHVIATYQRKLQELLHHHVFEDVRNRLDAALLGVLADETGSERLARHLATAREISTPRHLELIRAILKIEEPYRTFGLRLIRRKWGGVDWKLEDEPANRRFVEKLHERGIRFAPWTDSTPLRTATGPDGRTITMAFETDEIERLLMGYYFDTCLSTDGCNFFSAITNTVDVNKRVLYARDSQGIVLGRCLFAIGDGGTILTFHPYCHHGDFPFESYVSEIAIELAARMGTVVSHTDHVSPLLTPEWYNDGAREMGSINREDSSVRLALRSANAITLEATLNDALAPVGLTAPALGAIVELTEEFTNRPDLVEGLRPLVQRWEAQLSSGALLSFAKVAHNNGFNQDAVRLMMTHAPEWAVRRVREFRYFDSSVGEVIRTLIALHPQGALRLLRQTRQRNIRSDDDERDEDRRELLSLCYEALGRKNLAAKMSRRGDEV